MAYYHKRRAALVAEQDNAFNKNAAATIANLPPSQVIDTGADTGVDVKMDSDKIMKEPKEAAGSVVFKGSNKSKEL